MSLVQTITSDNFTEVVNQHDCVVVDFWAEWCQPCKNFSKVIDQVAAEYKQVCFGKVDIDAQKELAKDFNIVSVPFVMVIRYSTIIYAEAGLLTQTTLKELLDQALALTEDELKKQGSAQ